MAPPYAQSGLAAVTFWGTDIRVYYQDTEDYINESVFNSGTWSAGGRIGAQARLGSPMAAVAWGADPQIRVMYADRNNILSEYAWNPNNQWQPGTLQQLDLTQQGLGLTATIVTGKNIRLYYLPNSTSAVAPIIELASTGDTWTQTSATIKTGFRFRGGTSLASTAWRDSLGNHIRIYYASEFASVQEMSFDDNVSGGWRQSSQGQAVGSNGVGAQLAAINWGPQGNHTIRTYSGRYFLGPNPWLYLVAEHKSDPNNNWSGPAYVATLMPPLDGPGNPFGAMAAVTMTVGGKQIVYAFMQGTTTPIGRAKWDDGVWGYDGAVPVDT